MHAHQSGGQRRKSDQAAIVHPNGLYILPLQFRSCSDHNSAFRRMKISYFCSRDAVLRSVCGHDLWFGDVLSNSHFHGGYRNTSPADEE